MHAFFLIKQGAGMFRPRGIHFPISRKKQGSGSGFRRSAVVLALGVCWAWSSSDAQAADDVTQLERVVVKAQEELKQTLGASVITQEDLSKSPPANDVSEILRTMPGVNLTGNSTSGQRGNNRQIDIRGMGPENTLILVDGKPVSSRTSVRYGWRGERDSRGDTNWVPPEQIERIEVLRGPAAARYGNGAAGGVVNIITKSPGDSFGGDVTVYMNHPQHSDEGATRRSNFSLNGPINDKLAFRVYGGISKTDSDAFDINKGHESVRKGSNLGSFPAGREGVRNRDINGLLNVKLAPGHELDLEAGFSRQGNIYTADTQNTNRNDEVMRHLGDETNRLYRQNYSLTHRGDWNSDTSTLSYIQYERTRNSRLVEGLAGGTEGAFNDPNRVNDGGMGDIDMRTLTAHTELSRRFTLGSVEQMGTLGLEWVEQKLNDPVSELGARNPVRVPDSPTAYQAKSKSRIMSVFAESNMYVTDTTTLTPGLRMDHHNQHGVNWSPSLNLSQELADSWTLKAGIARAYKAPNLYQSNAGYALYSAGNGCWGGSTGGSRGCFLAGNPDLKPETSLNKELGIEYAQDGTIVSLTYFHNDYRNKVEAGHTIIGTTGTNDVFQWENIPKAVVSGLEGNITLPLADSLLWQTNYTYMLESKNKSTGERLSTIPEYTINSTLDWAINEQFSLRGKVTLYGEQKPPKFDYYGEPVVGTAADTVSPYALLGFSGQYRVNKHLRLTAGIDNLLDKRIHRRGNASGVNLGTPNEMAGAGAYTYNQPGRTFFVSATSSF